MGTMASQITSITSLFGRRSKKTSKLRVTGLCVGNSPGTGEFPAQMASNAENVSISWRHHGRKILISAFWVFVMRIGWNISQWYINGETFSCRDVITQWQKSQPDWTSYRFCHSTANEGEAGTYDPVTTGINAASYMKGTSIIANYPTLSAHEKSNSPTGSCHFGLYHPINKKTCPRISVPTGARTCANKVIF